MRMATLKVHVKGWAALMMHSDKMADPTSRWARLMKEHTSQRKKTDETHLAMMHLEFLAALYHDGKEPYIPGINIEMSLVEAAKFQKLGKETKRSLLVQEERVHFEYAGKSKAKTAEDLWRSEEPSFRDVRGVVVSRSRVMRCRPIFRDWSAVFTVQFDADRMNLDEVQRIVKDAGHLVGLCDFRPRFGRFDVVNVE